MGSMSATPRELGWIGNKETEVDTRPLPTSPPSFLPSSLSFFTCFVRLSVTSKKSPNVYKSCPKMILLEKLKILTPLQKLPKNVGDLGKLIVAKGFEKLPKVQ